MPGIGNNETDELIEIIQEYLEYVPETGKLYWKKPTGGRKAGSLAGTLHHSKYVQVSIKKTFHPAHRVAYVLMNGRWPKNHLDHKNNIGIESRYDNRWDNLRDATRTQNMANTSKLHKHNTSGYRGVCWDKRKNKWMAKIQVKGKTLFVGYFETKEEAALAYNEAAIKYFGEFAYLNEVSNG